jgi:hypothetical protein
VFRNVFLPTTNYRTEIRWFNYSVAPREHYAWLDAEFGAALAATRRENRATGAGTHPKTETVNLRTATVVWLKSTL